MSFTRFVIAVISLAVLAHSSVIMYDINLVPEECIKNKAIDGDYVPNGEEITIGNLTVYEAPNTYNVTKRMLIGVYDIFGFSNPNMKQVTDEMASKQGGFRSILPDFYRGESWDPADFPPANPDELQQWLGRVGSWEVVVKYDLMNLVNHYRTNEGVEEFAIFGMCWGGKVVTLAATELQDYFKAGAMVHPASVTNAEADGVQIPLYLMPTQNEPDMLPFYEVMKEKFGNNSGHRRFDDMFHGFSGARGNFSDPKVQVRVNEVLAIMGNFFNKNLNPFYSSTDAPTDATTVNPNGSSHLVLPYHGLMLTLASIIFLISSLI